MKQFFLYLLLFFVGNSLYSQEKIRSLADLKGKDLKVGLVLSGGGAKGLAHIAALEAIEQAGVKID